MKRWIYFILPIILCSFAYSMSISILNPSREDIITGSTPFTVEVSNRGDGEEITNVYFYFKTSPNPSEPWQKIGEETGKTNETKYSITFDTTLFDNTNTGRIFVNATDSTGRLVGESDDIPIDIDNQQNNPPTYKDISNLSWPENTINELKLSDYFSDQDGDPLTFSVVDTPAHITPTIDIDKVTLTPDENFTGYEYITFQASDGTDKTTSHKIYLNITPKKDLQIAQNITQPETAVCGNNKEEAGEDCKNCPQDIKCPANYECNKKGNCIKKEKPSTLLILMIISIIILITIGAIIIYNKIAQRRYNTDEMPKKEEEESMKK